MKTLTIVLALIVPAGYLLVWLADKGIDILAAMMEGY